MIQTGLISPAHDDLVCDASFDYYGTRLATCGLDHNIKIWRGKSDGSGAWALEESWKAHDAPICSISWAHPEYGTLIASCSFDRTVKIWEHLPSFLEADQSNGTNTTRWKTLTILADAKGSVRVVEFSPQAFSLRLASFATDNILRVYECLDSRQFTLVDSLDIGLLSPAKSTPKDASGVVSASDGNVDQRSSSTDYPSNRTKEIDGEWTLSWCKDPYWGQLVAVGCGSEGKVVVVRIGAPDQRKSIVLTLDPYTSAHISSNNATQHDARRYPVTSVSWAPSCGRSYQSIATGSRDGHVRIWRVQPPPPSTDSSENLRSRTGNDKWSATLVGDFSDHEHAVSRVEWNVTGTLLTSAGNDGRVRLWKVTLGNVWRAMGSISAEKASTPDGHETMEE